MEQFGQIPATDVPFSKAQNAVVGPLWLGALENKTVIQQLQFLASTKELNTRPLLWRLLQVLEEESDAPPFFYTTDDLSSVLKVSPPTLHQVFCHLRDKGFLVSRTHYTPTGFKTNAPLDVITEVFK
jgi:tRNA (guanine26-N2/guanine27-N2)-dimethyltransferase